MDTPRKPGIIGTFTHSRTPFNRWSGPKNAPNTLDVAGMIPGALDCADGNAVHYLTGRRIPDVANTCPHCGIQLPPVSDAFCFSFVQALDEPPRQAPPLPGRESAPRPSSGSWLSWEAGVILIVLGAGWLLAGTGNAVPKAPDRNVGYIVGYLLGWLGPGLLLCVVGWRACRKASDSHTRQGQPGKPRKNGD